MPQGGGGVQQDKQGQQDEQDEMHTFEHRLQRLVGRRDIRQREQKTLNGTLAAELITQPDSGMAMSSA